MQDYNDYLNSRLQSTALALPECGPRTWYKDPQTGKLVAPAPWTATELWTRTRKIKFEDWKASRKIGDEIVQVDIKSPQTWWTPIDWFASKLQSYLIGLMDNV